MRYLLSTRALKATLALILVVPLSAPRAETDCASLDIALDPAVHLPEVSCDNGSFSGGGPSHTMEAIVASGPASFFIVRHGVAGVRTYFIRMETRELVDRGTTFAKIEDWTV